MAMPIPFFLRRVSYSASKKAISYASGVDYVGASK
jgi:hypothetical protein